MTTHRTLPSRRHRSLWDYADEMERSRAGSFRHMILARGAVRVVRIQHRGHFGPCSITKRTA